MENDTGSRPLFTKLEEQTRNTRDKKDNNHSQVVTQFKHI